MSNQRCIDADGGDIDRSLIGTRAGGTDPAPALPDDYLERVYAGVLGKIIGVYLGRPFEGWDYAQIRERFGEIDGYVHEELGVPLVVTDDDISGTFTFLRALEDCGCSAAIAPEQIGDAWLNYIIERKTILWWGGMGNSTEHTSYLRLKSGMAPPASGSIATNGKVVAEQIGAQIFIDGWGMVAPGRPDLAADLARRAASVSHDGEAIYGAQVIAAMEALAFVEPDLNALLDAALAYIPSSSVIAGMIADIRRRHAEEPDDWRANRARLEERYGYDRYGGNCHVVPNHGLIILALLHGNGDFSRSLSIVNTGGWDTDCNSGNLGCLLGIRNGLAGIDAGGDWRGPVADRLYLPTADSGRCITDAVAEAVRIANMGRALAGRQPIRPKDGARFHFSLPGSIQGFAIDCGSDSCGATAMVNADGRLRISFENVSFDNLARLSTPTFVQPEALSMSGYELSASPTLYPGQTLVARLMLTSAESEPVSARLVISAYDGQDGLTRRHGPWNALAFGASKSLVWVVPDTGGFPIAGVGIEIGSEAPTSGSVDLDSLTWDGCPKVVFGRTDGGRAWRAAWAPGTDVFHTGPEPFRLIQNEGTGLLIQGAREWRDYTVSSTITPHMAERFGIAARVQGMRRYYALALNRRREAQIVKALDGERVLASVPIAWEFGEPYALRLSVAGSRIVGEIDGERHLDVHDPDRPLEGGAIALLVTEGRVGAETVSVHPNDCAGIP
jgi:ADP-ribosylglycohydrolase